MANPPAIEHGKFYHIFNQGNNRENIFVTENNYHYFILKYEELVSGIVDTFSFNLLQNHFHLFLRIKDLENIPVDLRKRKPGNIIGDFLSGYARAFNNSYDRTGSLFKNPFGRKEVQSAEYIKNLVVYIHQNPERHGFVKDFREWPFSSYYALTSHMSTFLHKEKVINWFGGTDAYISAHNFSAHVEDVEK